MDSTTEQPHALLKLAGRQLALARLGLINLAYGRYCGLQRLGALLDQQHRQADIEEVDGDAAAHGAGAEHAHLLDRSQHQVLRKAGHAAGLALGEKQVAQRA